MEKDKKPLMQILLVDGNKSGREAVKSILQSAGMAAGITECAAGGEAIELLSADPSKYDVALVDQNLPGLTGSELCRVVREKNLPVPLVLLIEAGAEEVALEALKGGADDYLVKGSKVYPEMLPVIVKKRAKKQAALFKDRPLEERLFFLGKALDTSNLGVTVTDFDGKIIYTNPAEAAMHGYSVEELTGKEARILAPKHTHQTPDKDLLKKAGTKKREMINLKKDGSSFPVFLTTDVVRDGSGEPIGFVSICEDITDRKEAEKALLEANRESLNIMEDLYYEIEERKIVEAQLRRLTVAVEQSPVSIMITDPDGKIEYVNPEFTASSGYSAKEAMGENPRIVQSGNHTEAFYKELWETITAGKTWRGDFQNRKKNGELYWESASISPIKDDDGKIINFVGIKTDVTGRRAQEEEIRRQHLEQEVLNYILALSLEDIALNELLEKCLNEILSIPFRDSMSTGAIFTVDRATEALTLAVNKGLNDNLLKRCEKGIPLGTCLCGRVARSGDMEFADSVDDRHEITYEGMEPHGHYCIPIKTKKEVLGVISLYLNEGCQKNDRDITFLESIAATMAGIIERKEIEDKLRESEKKYRDIIATTREGYWLLDMQKKALDINDSLSRMIGYSREEMIGRTPMEFADEENRQIFLEQTSKIETTDHRVYEVTLKAKDGTDVPTIFHATTLRGIDGTPYGAFSFITDISELKRVEKNLRLAKEEAEEATKLKDKFVSLVSHDLKNPINLITNYFDLLKITEQVSNKGKEMIEEGMEACGEMTSLINEVLNLSRIQGGRIVPAASFVHAHGIAGQAIMNYRRIANDKGIEIISEIPETAKVYADERLLLEVFRNLISNSMKFCKKGDSVKIYMPGGEPSTIAIADTGIGLDKARITTLFRYEEKTSTRGTSGESGTGLGLPLCRDIIAAHGGRLEVESELDKGCTFYIRLPHMKPTILIVDDDESIRQLFGKWLEKLDVTVLEAGNGEEALGIMKEKRPHLFFVDLHMPGIGGLELLAQIKKNPENEKTPVIVVTADKTLEVVDQAFLQGADDFIVKPFGKGELIERVEKFLK